MLSADQLAVMQATQNEAMDVPGILIKRVTSSTDNGNGLSTPTLTTIATVTGGWKTPTAQIMQQYASLIGSQASWIVRLPYGTDCLNADHIVMPTGEVLTVQADLSQSSYSTCKRVLATKVR